MFSNFEKYFFGGHFLFFLRRVTPQKSCFWPFLTPYDWCRQKQRSSLCSKLRTDQFSFFKSWKKLKKNIFETPYSWPPKTIFWGPPWLQRTPRQLILTKNILWIKNILFSVHMIRKQDIFQISNFGGHSRPPGGPTRGPPCNFL